MKVPIHDEHAAPHYMAGLGNAFDGSATEPEVHGWLTLAGRAFKPTDQVSRGNGARNQEDPNIIVNLSASVVLAPTQT